MSHAYFFAGEKEEGIERALAFVEKELNLPRTGNADVVVLRHALLSVDEARSIGDFARQAPLTGDKKAIILSADRLFHEAQNAFLKLFEEPPEGTYLFLIVASEGMILPTLRSRMQPLPGMQEETMSKIAAEFLSATKAKQGKIVEDILSRAKSSDDEEKRNARTDARLLGAGLMRAAYEVQQKKGSPELAAFLEDLDRFMPILYESSAPLKPIFEHLMITLPKDLVR